MPPPLTVPRVCAPALHMHRSNFNACFRCTGSDFGKCYACRTARPRVDFDECTKYDKK